MSEPLIEPVAGLPPDVLDEIAALEARVLNNDGGRLKLEWSSLRTRAVEVPSDVLVRAAGRLVGFAGVYRHGGEPELTGVIDPAYRLQGLGTRTLVAALGLVTDSRTVLLVVPRTSAGGRRLAEARGGVLDHSEHALVQRAAPPAVVEPDGLRIRPATETDRAAVDRLLASGFGDPQGSGDRLANSLVADVGGHPVGTLAVERDGSHAAVFGFVVDPGLRGRGLGRAILGRVCRGLRADGVREIRLEVEVDNERALGLYTALGFEPVTTEDYYRLATS